MKTKEQAIKEAYKEYWDEVKDYVDENGLLDKQVFSNHKGISYEDISNKISFIHYGNFCIPKSLKGIEVNNGWIKIESDNDLPKEDCDCHFKTYSNNYFLGKYVKDTDNFINIFYSKVHYGDVSHYKQIENPKEPIY